MPGWNGMDGYCTALHICPAHSPPPHVDAHANAMLCPCPISQGAGCRRLLRSTTSRASSIQETIHSKGRGGRRRLPLSPSWLPGRALFIKLNIGIDLDDLTIWPDLGCPGPALPLCIPRLRVGHVVCLPHRRTGKSSRRIAGGRPRPRDTASASASASARFKTCSCRAVRYPSRYRAIQHCT